MHIEPRSPGVTDSREIHHIDSSNGCIRLTTCCHCLPYIRFLLPTQQTPDRQQYILHTVTPGRKNIVAVLPGFLAPCRLWDPRPWNPHGSHMGIASRAHGGILGTLYYNRDNKTPGMNFPGDFPDNKGGTVFFSPSHSLSSFYSLVPS